MALCQRRGIYTSSGHPWRFTIGRSGLRLLVETLVVRAVISPRTIDKLCIN